MTMSRRYIMTERRISFVILTLFQHFICDLSILYVYDSLLSILWNLNVLQIMQAAEVK